MKVKVSKLFDVDPVAVSIVKKGANRQRFFLMKSEGTLYEEQVDGTEPLTELPFVEGLIKADDDWSAVYCVVAAPGVRENPGMLAKAGDPDDEWASEEEIRKAAHRFMKNGALINKMHEDLEQYGTVVENAVALTDIEVNGHTIAKGSWYLAIEPTDEGKKAIEDGDFTGVSLQGTGKRQVVEVEKADPKGQGTKGSDREGAGTSQVCSGCKGKVKLSAKTCPNCNAKLAGDTGQQQVAKVGGTHERTIGSKGNGLWGIPHAQLPAAIQHVYNDLVEQGKPTGSTTYRLAVGIVRNWSEGHDGKGNKVSAKVQAQAVKAMAEWEKLRAKAKATPNKGTKGAIAKIAAALGISVEDDLAAEDEPLEKADVEAELEDLDVNALLKAAASITGFADRVKARRAGDEISRAHDAMRSVLYDHFYPYTLDGEPIAHEDARKSLDKSLGQYRAHVLAIHDGIASGDIRKSAEELTQDLGSLGANPQEDDDDMGDDSRIEKLEQGLTTLTDTVGDLAKALKPLADKIEEQKAPTVEDLHTGLDSVNAEIAKLQAGIERLGQGSTKQPETVQKSTSGNPLAGILD